MGGAYIIRFRKLSVVMTGSITALSPGELLDYTWKENYGMPRPRCGGKSSPPQAAAA